LLLKKTREGGRGAVLAFAFWGFTLGFLVWEVLEGKRIIKRKIAEGKRIVEGKREKLLKGKEPLKGKC
jgi:hypothetical protein